MFDDILKSNETIFKNPMALDFDYIPKLIPFRENEQKYIAECIKPLFNKRNGRNVFIYGLTGVGKTLAVKNILREIEEKTDEIFPIYVNCWQRNSSFKVFSTICNILGYKQIFNKNSDELFEIIKKIINQKSAIFVFDEFDKAEEYDFLYSILEEIYLKVIILITNNKENIIKIEPRIKSRLLPTSLEFKPYNLYETKEILKQRVNIAFYPNVINEDAFEEIVNKTYELKDIRIGLFLLRESGNLAEINSRRKITREDVIKSIEKLDTLFKDNLDNKINKESNKEKKLTDF